MASNAENVFIEWRHHVLIGYGYDGANDNFEIRH